MNNAFTFDECGNIMPSKSRQPNSSHTQVLQYEVPRWRQESGPKRPPFPPLDMIGSDSSYHSRMAPPMDRIANRSRSPMNLDRRFRDYRSRTPPTQHSTSFRMPSRPHISYPQPLYSRRDESPTRIALRSEVPPQFSQRDRHGPAESRLPYPTEGRSPPRPLLRLSPVTRSAPAPREIIPPRPAKPEEYIISREIPRPSAGPLSDVTRDLLPKPKPGQEAFTSEVRTDLIPKPLNPRNNPTIRKETPSICEYLSLDELENLWQKQDLYSGTITAPAKPCSPMYGMVSIGPMSPSLADHPAFRNEYRQYNSFACA